MKLTGRPECATCSARFTGLQVGEACPECGALGLSFTSPPVRFGDLQDNPPPMPGLRLLDAGDQHPPLMPLPPAQEALRMVSALRADLAKDRAEISARLDAIEARLAALEPDR